MRLRFNSVPAAVHLFLCAVCCSWALAPAARGAAVPGSEVCRDVSAQPAELQVSPRGIFNFGQVSPTLFRGGQPSSQGYRELKRMGIELVISFRHERGENSLERREVEAHGMRFVSLPWQAWETPTDEAVLHFLELIKSNPGTKIFVHCQQGRDRTGMMVALYRVAVEHWCPASAVSEMKAYHYHHFWFPQLESYVEAFPQHMAQDSRLSAAAPAFSQR